MLSLNPDKLHHAYLLVGDKNTLEAELIAFLKDRLAFSTIGNPDFVFERQDTLTIEKARELQDFHIRRSFDGGRKIFVLIAGSIPVEAQNALLKLFEEPIAGNHFFLIMDDDRAILPTLRSRMETHRLHATEEGKAGKVFLTEPIPERLKIVNAIVQNKSREEGRNLIRSLIAEIRSAGNASSNPLAFALEDLVQADDYLSDRSPSLKIILEHIVHILPVQG